MKAVREKDPELVSQARVDATQKRFDKEFEVKKDEVMGQLKDMGNKLLGNFGISLDNFKLNQNTDGSYGVTYGQK